MPRLTQAELSDLNKTFEERTPQELIRWASEMFGDRLAAISAMQKSGTVVCHMLSQLKSEVPVLFVDTGVMFAETLATRDRVATDYGIPVRTLSPELTMAEQTDKHGVLYLSVEGQEQCCHMRKVDPLLNVKDEYDALIGSLRRSDGGKRGELPILSIDPEMNALRVNVLANVDEEALESYIVDHDVITNPLHEQGYATISCNRCTTPILPHEDKRVGRWRHLGPSAMFCGINPTDVSDGSNLAIELPQDLIDRVLGRMTDFMI